MCFLLRLEVLRIIVRELLHKKGPHIKIKNLQRWRFLLFISFDFIGKRIDKVL